VVLALIESLGTRALDAGPLANAVALESLTPVLLQLNRKYKRPGVGIRFTGL
jgi:predicted dinucleotide-binding enzyme